MIFYAVQWNFGNETYLSSENRRYQSKDTLPKRCHSIQHNHPAIINNSLSSSSIKSLDRCDIDQTKQSRFQNVGNSPIRCGSVAQRACFFFFFLKRACQTLESFQQAQNPFCQQQQQEKKKKDLRLRRGRLPGWRRRMQSRNGMETGLEAHGTWVWSVCLGMVATLITCVDPFRRRRFRKLKNINGEFVVKCCSIHVMRTDYLNDAVPVLCVWKPPTA